MNRTTASHFGLLALLSSLVVPAAPAAAEQLFRGVLVVGVNQSLKQTNNIFETADFFGLDELREVDISFDPTTQSAVAGLSLRGLPTVIGWEPTTTTLSVVVLGKRVDFTRSTIEQAVDDLDAWLDGTYQPDGAELTLTDVLQGLVEFSPVDPVAGNPNSLQSRMFQTDFELGTQGPFTSGNERLDPSSDQVAIGFDYGYASGGPYGVNALDLPMSYRLNFRDPKWSLLFSLPLTATFTEGQWSVLASGGAGVQYRPMKWWSLSLMGRVGAAGSLDVGALGFLYSVTVTNHMRYEWRGIEFAMGNMVGFTKTIDGIEIAGIEFTYDLTNPILTNGLSVAGRTGVTLLGHDLAWRGFGWNTQVFGDSVYMSSQNEIGAALDLLSSLGGASYESTSLSLGYVFGNGDYDGLTCRLRFRF